MRQRLAVLGILALFWVAANAADRKYIVGPRAADAKDLPFSDAVVAGNTLYIAGHIGVSGKAEQNSSGGEEEARLVMNNVKQTVESAGFAMDDIVSLQVFCTDLKLYEAFNSVYRTYFHGHFPARAFVGVDKLVRGAKFEVTGIAVKKSQ